MTAIHYCEWSLTLSTSVDIIFLSQFSICCMTTKGNRHQSNKLAQGAPLLWLCTQAHHSEDRHDVEKEEAKP